eukprot:8934810-Karenia_brevis.AAC.1
MQPPRACYIRLTLPTGIGRMPPEIRVDLEVVAYDYRGSTGIVLRNFGSKPFNLRQGQCVAQ